ncbi:hypothetical protein J6590_022617 [Homalodisca vitripennis]|nr:hypothetical protein J6590_022617 [Homalodisca vitripennis]
MSSAAPAGLINSDLSGCGELVTSQNQGQLVFLAVSKISSVQSRVTTVGELRCIFSAVCIQYTPGYHLLDVA